MKATVFLLAAMGFSVIGRADLFPFPIPTPEPVSHAIEYWSEDFDDATNRAAQADVPAVLMYGINNCVHCENLEAALRLDTDWARTRNAVFYHVVAGEQRIMNFITDNLRVQATPVIRVYWRGRRSEIFSGQDLAHATHASLNPAVAADRIQLLALLDDFKRKVTGIVPEIDRQNTHVAFPMGDSAQYPGDRLEAVAGVTKSVTVPLVRTNAFDKTATSVVSFQYNGGVVSSQTVSWKVGERERFVTYAMPSGFQAGKQVAVTLRESAGAAPIATCHIWCVAASAYGNSPKNPRWIGERTASALAWGEWTMDFDVARQKVSQASGSGTLVLVGGSLWCPDCYSTDEYLIDTPEFRQWASSNKVACVAIDVTNPKNESYPCLLKWNSMRVSDRYVTCNNGKAADESLRYQSGAGYLSRHGVSAERAGEIYERNQNLLCRSTAEGGLCRPEDVEGDGRVYGFKTGIPCLILLRPDGTIAGRIYQFSNTSASSAKDLAAHIQRLNELLGQVALAGEEDNDHQLTTPEALPFGRKSVTASLSAVDGQDVFRIGGGADDRIDLSLSGSAAATVTLTVTDDSGAVPVKVGEATGVLSQGVALSAKLTSAACHLTVGFPKDGSGYALEGPFAFTRTVSTVCSYTLGSNVYRSGGEVGFAASSASVVENCGTVKLAVVRRHGSKGEASVKVRLLEKSGEGVDERIKWTDQDVSWADGDSSVKYVNLTVTDDATVRHEMVLTFGLDNLTGGQPDLEVVGGEMTLTVYDDEYNGTPVYCGVGVNEERSIPGYTPRAGDEIRLAVTEGELPPGVVLAAVGGKVVATGCTNGSYGEYRAVCSVSVWRDGVRIVAEKQLDPFVFTVIAFDFASVIPSLAEARTYGNLPVIRSDLLAGLLTVSIPTDGMLSAKYVAEGRTVAYSSDGWESFDQTAGRLTARLRQTTDSSRTMSVTLDAVGGRAWSEDPAFDVEFATDPWPNGSAAAWQGQYAVQMPQTNVQDLISVKRLGGAAYMAMRMVSDDAIASGTMLYAGVLPNGRAVYGSSVLIASGTAAVMPFAASSDMVTAPYSLSGAFWIAANAAVTYQTERWSVKAAVVPTWSVPDDCGHAGEFNVFGGYYDSKEVTERFNEQFAGQLGNFAFQADTASLLSGLYGEGEAMSPVPVRMTADDAPELVAGAANPQGVTLSFSKDTGVISGSFEIPFADGVRRLVFYRGMALPGWQNCATCVIGVEAVERPWAVGSCSFADLLDSGSVFRNGCEIKLDKVTGGN